MIRVLIVDDSSVFRSLFTRILSSDPEIEVVGTAPDPYVAREKIAALKPDVITLDIEMPRMDGVTFLEKIMQHFPIRTLIVSSLSTKGSEIAFRALELGAIDVMAKPILDTSIELSKSMAEMGVELISRVKMVAKANIRNSRIRTKQDSIPLPPKKHLTRKYDQTNQILAIAASTGGTQALKTILPQLPSDLPGTVIVQHMPPVFTKNFAEHLQKLCAFEVKQAEDGDAVMQGRALIAPGNFHMEIVRRAHDYFIKLHQEPLLNGVRPAADYLFKSVAKQAGSNSIGVVLTGMGKDGAKGLLEMKAAGSFNIAQDEESCVIFGMPKSAIEIGAIDCVRSLEQIVSELSEHFPIKQKSG